MPAAPKFDPIETSSGWMVSVPPSMAADGRRHRKFFATEREAARYASKLRGAHNAGQRAGLISANLATQAQEAMKILEPTGVGLLEAAKIVARQMAASGSQETFRVRYKRVLLAGEGRWSDRYELEMARVPRWVPEKFMDMPCGTIDRAVIEKALVEDRELTRATLEMRARMILAILNYRERHRKSSEIKILTLAEVESVLGNCQSPEERRVVALLAFAGIRPDAESGEIARLDWEAVGAKEIYIAPTTSKTGSDRHIEITPRLRAEIDGHPTEGPVLPANWRRAWQRIRKAAGIAGEQDILRHSFASHMLAATNEERTKSSLGHTAGSSTLFRHYRRAVTRADGLAYFGLKPSSKG
jgi:integrase